jgi:hypothetical protein
MKKIIILISALIILSGVLYFTKPDDKTCIIAAVEAVWGSRTPDKYKMPEYFEQFMNLNSPSVKVEDWVLLKRIKYNIAGKEYIVGYGVLNKCYTRAFKMEL